MRALHAERFRSGECARAGMVGSDVIKNLQEILDAYDRKVATARASGTRAPAERFDNRTNPDGTALVPGGFTDADHVGKRYAAPGCGCSACKGKQVKP